MFQKLGLSSVGPRHGDFGRVPRKILLCSVSVLGLAVSGGSLSPAFADTCTLGSPATWSLGSNGTWNTATNWSPSVVPTGGVNVCIVDNASTVTIDTNPSIGQLQLGTGNGLNLNVNQSLSVGSNITNAGSIVISGALQLTGSSILSGPGTLTLNAGINSEPNGAAGTDGGFYTLTNQSTIQGNGVIGSNAGALYSRLNLNNSGLVNANTTGKILTIEGGLGFSNSGTLEATNGGTLNLATPVSIQNGGGTISAIGSGSTVSISTGVINGTLTTSGGGVLQTVNSTATLDGQSNGVAVTLSNGSTLTSNNAQTDILGTLNLGTGTGATLALGGALELIGQTTLSGTGGVVNITGDGTNSTGGQIGTNGNGYTLTNNVTIQGSGTIGSSNRTYGNLTLTNNGTINANSNGQTLSIQGSGSSITNSGLFEATNGGTLNLSTGAFIQNAGANITATGPNSTVTVATIIQGGTLTTSNGGVIQTANQGYVTLLDGQSNSNAITLSNGTNLISNNTLTNILGTLNLGTGSGATLTLGGALQLTGQTTLSGAGGVVNMTGNGTNSTGAQIGTNGNGYTLTNNVTIQGSGTIGSNNTTYGNLNLANYGTINANTNGQTLSIQSTGGSIVNSGLFEATNGGTLNLATSAPIQNYNATISATGANSTVSIGTTIQGGTIGSSGGGIVQIANTGATLDGQTNGAAITLSNGTNLISNNTLTNILGTLNLGTGSGATLTLGGALQLTGQTTLSGAGGVVNMTGNGTNSTGAQIGTNGNGYTLTNNVTIQGSGTIGSNNTTYGNLNLANYGTINANTNGQTLSIQSTGGSIVNSGLFEATNGGILNLATSSPIQNAGANITATGAGSTVNVATTIQGGTFNSSGGGVIQGVGTTLLDGQSNGNAITISNGSTYTSGSSAFTKLQGTINLGTTNAGTLALGGQAQLVGQVTLAGPGVLAMSGNAQIGTNSNAYTLTNQSTIEGSGLIGSNVGALYSNGNVVNQGAIIANGNGGTLTVANTGGLSNSGTLQANAGSTLAVTAPLSNLAGNTLTGGVYSANGGTLQVQNASITTNAAEIDLAGSAAKFTDQNGTNALANFTNNAGGGLFNIQGGANFTAPGAFTNNGVLLVGAAGPVSTFTAGAGINGTNGTIQISNSGSVSLGAASSTGTLAQNGALALGSNNITISTDYTNTNFGSGNSFNNHAGVTGTGKILAAGTGLAMTVSGTGITNGSSSSPTLAVGNVHTGSNGPSGSFNINWAGTGAPVLRGAVQTSSGITVDAPTFGSTTLDQYYHTIKPGGSATENYTISAGTAGSIAGQTIKVVSNFDNVAAQTIALSGAAYDLANPNTAASPVKVGNVHVGSTASQTLAISNTTISNAAFQEGLNASVSGTTGSAITSGGPIVNLGAGAVSNAISVGLNATTAGAINGTATLALASNGATTSGLGTTTLAPQTVTVTGAGYNYASPSLSANPINLGNFHVGDTASQGISIFNRAIGDVAYQEGLNVSVSGTSGAVTTSGGPITNLAAGTGSSAITANLSTATAGAVTGSATLALASNGATTSGLGITNLAPQTVNVTGAVYNYASASTIAPINLVLHTGQGVVTQALSISNTAAANGYSEALDASFGGYTNGTGSLTPTFAGSVVGLAAGATNNTGLTVSVNTASVGTVNGSVRVNLVSDGTGIDNLGTTSLGSQNVSVSGSVASSVTVTNLASPTINTSQPISFGNVRLGSTTTAQNVSVTNSAPVSSFSEGLIGVVTGTSNAGITASGGFGIPGTSLAAGQTNSTGISVNLNTATAGAISGNAVVNFKSDGTAFAGGTVTDLGNTNVTVNGNVYRLASPTLNTASLTLASRVGGSATPGAISVTNTSSDVYAEGLAASLGSITGAAFNNAGSSITNLAAQGTDASSLKVGLSTATSGTFTGSAKVNYTSNGLIDSASAVSVGSGSVALNGLVYQTAAASVAPSVSFGIVHVGDTVGPQAISVGNTASGALVDVITGNVASVTGSAFTNGGSTLAAGVAAGNSSTALTVGLNTATAGVFSGAANLALASHDASLSDVALSVSPVTLAATVNNYAFSAFTKSSGAGTLSGSGSNFTLNLGNITQGSSALTAVLGALNGATGQADLLDGSFIVTSGSGFTLSGLTNFTNVAAGAADPTAIDITLNPTGVGLFSETIELVGVGHNSSGYSAGVANTFLTINADVLASGGTTPVPEPASTGVFATALAMLAGLVWRRRARANG